MTQRPGPPMPSVVAGCDTERAREVERAVAIAVAAGSRPDAARVKQQWQTISMRPALPKARRARKERDMVEKEKDLRRVIPT